MPKRLIAIITDAPQSIRKLDVPRCTIKQVFRRPPDPKASPEPRTCTRIVRFPRSPTKIWPGLIMWARHVSIEPVQGHKPIRRKFLEAASVDGLASVEI